ncbi:MAG: Rab family GTPase [Candidatus Odinarchaeota archaeon]
MYGFPSPIRKKKEQTEQEKKATAPRPTDRRIDLSQENRFKVVICGNAAVGKTTLINRHMLGEFTPYTRPTPGINMVDEPVVMKPKQGVEDSGISIEGQISYWDLGGQTMFSQLRPMYMQGANGVMLCFNLNEESSLLGDQAGGLDESIGIFLKELIVSLGSDTIKETPFVLIGTKSDLKVTIDTRRLTMIVTKLRKAGLNIISWEKDTVAGVQAFGKFAMDPWERNKWETGPGWIPTSSKTGDNVGLAFEVMKIALFNAHRRKMMDLMGTNDYSQKARLSTSMRATTYSRKETDDRKKKRYDDDRRAF